MRRRFGIGFEEAVDAGYRRAHAEHRVEGVQRLLSPEGIAADVPEDGQPVLRECVEEPSVRAARAHDRWSYRDLFGGVRRDFQSERGGDELLRILADGGGEGMALYTEPESFAVALDHRIKLLDDDETVDRRGEIRDLL